MANEPEYQPAGSTSPEGAPLREDACLRSPNPPRGIPLVPGLPVIGLKPGERVPGHLVGYTDDYCLYRLPPEDFLIVAPWADVAIGGLQPSAECLPNNPHERARRDHLAGLFWRLTELAPFTLTAAQEQTHAELNKKLGGDWGR